MNAAISSCLRLDEFYFAFGAVQCAENAIDAITGITKNSPHPPRVQPLNKEVTDSLGHAHALRYLPARPGNDRNLFFVPSVRGVDRWHAMSAAQPCPPLRRVRSSERPTTARNFGSSPHGPEPTTAGSRASLTRDETCEDQRSLFA